MSLPTAKQQEGEDKSDLLKNTEGLTWANISSQLHPEIGKVSSAAGVGVGADMGAQSVMASPTISRLRKEDMKMFGVNPLSEDLVLIQCRDCGKSLIPSSFAEHLQRCRRITASSKRTPINPSAAASFRSSPQDDITMQDAASSSAADEEYSEDLGNFQEPVPGFMLKRKRLGAIDLDSQCSVMTPLGTPCTRPLTCHVHSMYAKSGVSGRSCDFETLLKNYQNSLTAQMLGLVDTSACKENRQESRKQASEIVVYDEKFLDADKEVDALVEMLQARISKPVASNQFVRVKSQTIGNRMRDLFTAIVGKNQGLNSSTSMLSGMNITRGPLSSALNGSAPSHISDSAGKPTGIASPKRGRSSSRARKASVDIPTSSTPLISPSSTEDGTKRRRSSQPQVNNTINPQDVFAQPVGSSASSMKADPRNFKFM